MGSMKLSTWVIGVAELNRVLRELKRLDELVAQNTYRQLIAPADFPSVSRSLEQLATVNTIDLAKTQSRSDLRRFLEETKAHAPTVHIGLAHQADDEELAPLVSWVRAELCPTALVTVGIQPGIIGGCTVRTTNHYYDFSLKQHFDTAREALLTNMKAL